MINAVLFDLYGTLIDIRTEERSPEVYWTLSRYLAYHGVKIGQEELQDAFFRGINKALTTSLEPFAEVNIYDVFSGIMHSRGNSLYHEQSIADLCKLFRSLTIRRFELFPEVLETLSLIQSRYLIGLVSDAQWVFTEPELSMTGLDRFFPVRVLSSRYGYKKPDSRMFKMVLERLGVEADRSVYIGDNPQRDLAGAKGTGMRCILFRNESARHNGFEADGIFHNYVELMNILESL